MQTISVRGRVFNYSHTIGRNSDAGTGFRYPVALARGNGDLLYVLNRGDEYTNSQRVTAMTLDEEFIRDIGSMGEGDGQFIWPTAIDLDSDGNIFVADEWLNRMTIFDPEGNFLDRWGTPGPKEGQLNGPSGLVIDSTNNVYITDELSHRVQKFTRDGVYLSSWGQKGSGEGQLQNPWGDHPGQRRQPIRC
jgi:DNA-binding beta-propeller fold protein YncE